MNLTETRGALVLMTEMVEQQAAKVMDVTHQAKVDDDGAYEFVGFAARRNLIQNGKPVTDAEEITKLLDSLYSALVERVSKAPVTLWWRLKPELILSTNGFRIGARIKLTPAIERPKLVSVS